MASLLLFIGNSVNDLKVNHLIAIEGGRLTEDGQMNKTCKQVSVIDVQCAGCKELLFQPSVLNCGHVYCHSCMAGLVNERPECQVCHNMHPGHFAKDCLELDHFLKELFPKEYAIRQEKVRSNKLHEISLNGASETQNPNVKSCHAKDDELQINNADLSKAHVAVGCDSCGMYPIIGERYRCKDCSCGGCLVSSV